MDQVEFEPSPHWTATVLKAGEEFSDKDPPTRYCDRCLVWNDVVQLLVYFHHKCFSLGMCILDVTWSFILLELVLSSFS